MAFNFPGSWGPFPGAQFPYTQTGALNMDWIICMVKHLSAQLEQFIKLNTVKYANPIQWSIASQYGPNTVVVDPESGTAYISVRPVPSGVPLDNTDYWSPVFDMSKIVPDTDLQPTFDNRSMASIQYDSTGIVNDGAGNTTTSPFAPYSLAPKPSKAADNALVVTDGRGNYIPLCLGDSKILGADDLFVNCEKNADRVLRFNNGVQISWGQFSQNFDITTATGALYRNTETSVSVGFTKSFNATPFLLCGIRGNDDFFVAQTRCNQNGITSIKILGPQQAASFQLTINYIAIGGWSA